MSQEREEVRTDVHGGRVKMTSREKGGGSQPSFESERVKEGAWNTLQSERIS